MINKQLLNSKLALYSYSQKDIAKILKKSITTINQKVVGNIRFLPEEIKTIKEMLNFTDSEVVEIFLS